MWLSSPTARRIVALATYFACTVAICATAGWGAVKVATTIMQVAGHAIIDGSGKAEAADDIAVPSSPAASGPDPKETILRAEASPVPRPVVAPTRVSSDNPDSDPAADFHRGGEGTYRTYCVRLCDGYYFPISFSTTADRFTRDQAACQSACGSPARLFVHEIPGGGPGTMVSLDGLRYTALKTAFMFRTSYDAQCRCQPQPWDEVSKDRHRLFAAVEAARKGNKSAASEVQRLTAKVVSDRRQSDAEREAKEVQATRQLAEAAERTDVAPPRRRPPAVAVRPLDGGFMGLGAQQTQPGKGRFIPASGSGRAWTERVFGGN